MRVLRITVAVVLALPIVWAAWASLQPIDRILATAQQTGDRFVLQWSNYEQVFQKLPFLRFLANSLLITSTSVIGTVFTSSLAGFAFSVLKWRGRRVLFTILLSSMMIPGMVLLVPQFFVYQSLGWVNTYKPLIVPAWLGGSAFYVFLFRQFFCSVPQAYTDIARLDGATNWQLYWHVMLPLAKPAIAAVAALSAVGHWQEFVAPLVYLSDYHWYPVSVGLRMFHAMEGCWVNLVMAASLVAMIPPLVIVFVAQYVLVRSAPEKFGG